VSLQKYKTKSLQFHCESRLENSYLLLFLFVNLLNGTEDSKPFRGGRNVGTIAKMYHVK
jgi:hypothetical protein